MEHCYAPSTTTTSKLPNYKPPMAENLEQLVEMLYKAFEGDEVDVDYVTELMESYKSNPRDWKKFAKFDRFKYTRNLVDQGNGKFDLMLLCWNPSQFSCIHDHADSHCFMKVLDGCLEEIRYSWPEGSDETGEIKEDSMKMTGKTPLPHDSVCYMNDSLGVHRVGSPSNVNPAVSLHLYSPPFSSCNVFEETSGRKCKCNVTFHSKFGQKVKHCV